MKELLIFPLVVQSVAMRKLLGFVGIILLAFIHVFAVGLLVDYTAYSFQWQYSVGGHIVPLDTMLCIYVFVGTFFAAYSK